MPDDEQTPLAKAQEAIDEAREAATGALPSDPLEGTAPEDDGRTADQQADDEELED